MSSFKFDMGDKVIIANLPPIEADEYPYVNNGMREVDRSEEYTIFSRGDQGSCNIYTFKEIGYLWRESWLESSCVAPDITADDLINFIIE